LSKFLLDRKISGLDGFISVPVEDGLIQEVDHLVRPLNDCVLYFRLASLSFVSGDNQQFPVCHERIKGTWLYSLRTHLRNLALVIPYKTFVVVEAWNVGCILRRRGKHHRVWKMPIMYAKGLANSQGINDESGEDKD
jgi:hypothetical protein